MSIAACGLEGLTFLVGKFGPVAIAVFHLVGAYSVQEAQHAPQHLADGHLLGYDHATVLAPSLPPSLKQRFKVLGVAGQNRAPLAGSIF